MANGWGQGTWGAVGWGGIGNLSFSVTGVAGTNANITITLPSSPQSGWEVGVAVGGTFLDTMVGRNGSNIMNLSEDFKIDVKHINVSFLYVDNTYGWKVV